MSMLVELMKHVYIRKDNIITLKVPKEELEECKNLLTTNKILFNEYNGTIHITNYNIYPFYDLINEYYKVKQFKFIKTEPYAVSPCKKNFSDVGFDLTLIKLHKKNGKIYYYDTCIKVQMPLGYYCTIEERSSTHKLGVSLRNKRGIIDPEYTGTIIVALEYDDGVEELKLPATVVQLIPHKLYLFKAVEALSFEETIRKDNGGLGSSQFSNY